MCIITCVSHKVDLLLLLYDYLSDTYISYFLHRIVYYNINHIYTSNKNKRI